MPRPSPRESHPQSRFCRYEDRQGKRCRRIATVDGALCREHAITLRMELEGSPMERVIGAIDREITKSRDPVVRAFGQFVSGLFSQPPRPPPRSGPRPNGQANGRTHQQANGQANARPPRQPPVNPQLEARRVLGFDPNQPLTAELVKARKKALGQLFHPDKQGGSTDAMARVNDAADVLLANLS